MTETPFGGESQNRLFIIIAIGLVGMLVLGLLAIGGYVIFRQATQSRAEVNAAAQTATAVAIAQATAEAPTEIPTPTLPPVPTDTPTPRVTNTPVVYLSEEAPEGTPELTPGAPTYTPTATPTLAEGETPSAGFGGMGIILAGLALAVVLVVARKARLAS